MGLSPRDSVMLGLLGLTRFAIDGDLVAYARALGALPLAGTDPTGMGKAYQIAMLTRDYAGAERGLAGCADEALRKTAAAAESAHKADAFDGRLVSLPWVESTSSSIGVTKHWRRCGAVSTGRRFVRPTKSGTIRSGRD